MECEKKREWGVEVGIIHHLTERKKNMKGEIV